MRCAYPPGNNTTGVAARLCPMNRPVSNPLSSYTWPESLHYIPVTIVCRDSGSL
jgi:hypothetical protein